MTARQNLILRVVVMAGLYFIISLFGGVWGWRLLYPIRIFVTFLHEFGHAFGAIITGGSVEYIGISPNTGGVTSSIGGNLPIILMGGYIGSALFGNILFYIGAAKPNWIKPALAVVIVIMLVTGFIWYDTLFTTAILCAFAVLLYLLGFKTKFGREALMFLGIASILFILQDTAAGPSSDLRAFEREMRFIPAGVWMVIWLLVALGLLAFNVRMLLRNTRQE